MKGRTAFLALALRTWVGVAALVPVSVASLGRAMSPSVGGGWEANP